MCGFVFVLMVEDYFVVDFLDYKGKILSFKIIEIELLENCLILLYKVVVENEREEKKKEIFLMIYEGDVFSGCVVCFIDFGVFVDLGGIDGLVYVLEIFYSYVVKLSDVLVVNDEVNVKVLFINFE